MEIKFFEEYPFPDDSIADIYKSVYNREFDLSYWNWRFKENPLEQKANIAYIKENGKLISFYAVNESRFINGNNSYKCGLMNSAMTRPEYAGRGLITKLEVSLHKHLFEEKDFSFVYGFANHNSHRIHRKHCGWKDLFVLNNFAVDTDTLLSKLGNERSCEYKVYNASDYEYSNIASLIPLNIEYGFSRNMEILKWRLRNPRNSYKVLEIKSDNGNIAGVLFFKEYLNGADIMEYFVSDTAGREHFLKMSLFILIRSAKSINIWSNLHSDEHLFLESLGFQEIHFNTYFGYIPNNIFLDEKKLQFRFLDSDVY